MARNMAEKQELAKHYYVKERMLQKEVADKVGVRAATISKWVKDGRWDKLRQSMLTTRSEQLSILYQQLEELNSHIMGKAEGSRFADAKQADVLSKITTAIERLERESSLGDVVEVFMKFNDFVRKNAYESLQGIVELEDAFIKAQLN